MKYPEWLRSHPMHLWIGIALSIPLLLAGATAVGFLGGDSWENKSAPAFLFPGYWMEKGKMENPDTRGFCNLPGGVLLGQNKALWWKPSEGDWQHLLHGKVEDMACQENSALVATDSGLYRYEGTTHVLLKAGKSQRCGINGPILWVSQKKMFYTSSDAGKTWETGMETPKAGAMVAYPSVWERKVNLKDLNHDLHTGKAIVGKQGEKIWGAVAGFGLAVLCISGIQLWIGTLRRRTKESHVV